MPEAVVWKALFLHREAPNLRGGAALVRAAVELGPSALQYASQALRSGGLAAMEAVSRAGTLLQHAAPNLRDGAASA